MKIHEWELSHVFIQIAQDLFSHHFVSSLAEATTLFLFFPNLALISARFVASKMEWLGFIFQTTITS